ncbi:MAG: glycoside hydrolase family 172 protein [Candidatus Bathyarchaeia archaeon]
MSLIGYTGLDSLPRLRDYTSHRVSSYDTTGGNRDAWRIKSGERIVLADIEGPGCIRHIWMTLGIPKEDYTRRIVLRFYWDDCPEPSVECPIGDFFGLGHGIRRNFVTLPLQMSPQDGKGFNSWWPMPFKKRAVIEVENQGEEAYWHYFYIDYEKYRTVEAVDDLAYFHVQWRREADTNGWAYRDRLDWDSMEKDPRYHNKDGKDNYIILEAKGNGIYCGAHLDIDCFHRNPNDWYGEGDDMSFIDGEKWPPSLHGTGTEDWFHCAYSPTEEYNAPYHGIILYSGTSDWPYKGKQTVYRYHIEDPIRFYKSIKVTIEHGHANRLSNDYSSTAYYYLSEPKRGGPPLPPVEERLPRPSEEVYKPKKR